MPWKCPACGSVIVHNPDERAPRFGCKYRCHICRLELTFDSPSGRMVVSQFDAQREADRRPEEPR